MGQCAAAAGICAEDDPQFVHATSTSSAQDAIGRFVVNGKRWKFITETEINFNKWKMYHFRWLHFRQFVFCVLFFRWLVIYLASLCVRPSEAIVVVRTLCLSPSLSLQRTAQTMGRGTFLRQLNDWCDFPTFILSHKFFTRISPRECQQKNDLFLNY